MNDKNLTTTTSTFRVQPSEATPGIFQSQVIHAGSGGVPPSGGFYDITASASNDTPKPQPEMLGTKKHVLQLVVMLMNVTADRLDDAGVLWRHRLEDAADRLRAQADKLHDRIHGKRP